MKEILIAAGALVVGVALGIVFSAGTIRHLRRRNRELRAALQEGRGLEKPETMKRVVWACVGNGFAWVWCSYYLAYTDHEQIAESLSQVAVTEIIGVVLAYCIKSAVENSSKNNRWPDKEAPPGDEESGEDEAAG